MSFGNIIRKMSGNSRVLQVVAGNVTLPQLPYKYEELEPYISRDIMMLHHGTHHAGYVKAFNAAEVGFSEAQEKGDIATMLSLVPVIKFNGGGHYNHSIFWTNLAPPASGGGGEPKGPLLAAIDKHFGSFAAFKSKLSKAATSVQGSGWGWLIYKSDTKTLDVTSTSNQDPVTGMSSMLLLLLSLTNIMEDFVPLLGFDVWEHAYYLQYKSKRAEYIDNIWNVVNWSNISERFEKAHGAK